MIITLLIGALLAGGAIALVARVVTMSRMRTADTLERIGGYGFAGRSADGSGERPVGTAVGEIAALMGNIVGGWFGKGREAQTRAQLMAAGLYNIPPRKFMGYRVLCAVSMPAVWVWTASASGTGGFLTAVGVLVAIFAGWSAPMVLVRNRARRRFEAIEYDLPELIDLLIVTMEAGLGFSGSLKVASDRLHGALSQELRLALQEQNMGLSTDEALRNMLVRCETPAMRSFVRSILQGEALGVSIGQIMRNLAAEMRTRRRQAAEERAQKAPIKLLFPLIFLIFPAMFVILLGPAVFSFMEAFGGGK
jgi:tight adherence protein C